MSNHNNTKPYYVLVVDDDYWEGELIGEYLSKVGAFSVNQVASIRGLWECLSTQKFDIILLDYKLPDGTGLEALIDLPVRGFHIPVIMLTGQGAERIAAQSIQRGARDYLVKGSDILTSLPARIEKAIQDHSLQSSAERALEQIRFQALLLNNVRDAVVVWDMKGVITYRNHAALRMFELPADNILNYAVEEHYFNRFTPPIREPGPEHTSGQHVERQFRNKNNELIWLSSQVSALRDYERGGKIIGYMDVCRDITKSKNMEAQLMQSTRMASFGELASGVAHQINNPLTTIIAEAQILLRNLPTTHPSREFAEAIEQAGWRTQKIVQQLIEFSQPAPNSFEYLDLNETITRALNLVSESIRSAGIDLEIQLHPDLPPVLGNAHRMEELWVNLLQLARGSSLSDASCTIRLESQPGPNKMVMIIIRNNCQNIPPEQLGSIFEPNLTSPVSGRGTGIELSICREIVRQHQGQITAENDPPHGTVIRIMFPQESNS